MAMPPTSTRPMEFRAAAPAPVTRVSGKVAGDGGGAGHQDRPQPGHGGLVHRLAAWLWPFSCSLLANSTIRMPFLETSPTRVTSPTWE